MQTIGIVPTTGSESAAVMVAQLMPPSSTAMAMATSAATADGMPGTEGGQGQQQHQLSEQTRGQHRPQKRHASISHQQPQPPNPHREAIQTTCKALNEAGDSIKWAKGTLNGYVTDFFGDGITYENANDAQLKSIAADLAKRLGSMQKTATAAGGK